MTNISATIIQRSKSSVTGKEIVTFELVYPRMVHSELMTHRMFSRNSASSRAIPILKVVDMVRDDYATPSHWGKNQPGMQAKEELSGFDLTVVQNLWEEAAFAAASYSEAMAKMGAHKQVANRVTEPYQWMKVVLTYTEGNNWYWLRDHEDADPTIHELARKMWEALEARPAFEIHPGEWHVPYVQRVRAGKELKYYTEVYLGDDEHDVQYLTVDEALAVSSSCCAQVSYRTLDLSLDKAKMIFSRLVESEPVHASPFEHQASPMIRDEWPEYIDPSVWIEDEEEGITHADRERKYWSGNFQGYIQHRQLIKNNVKRG